MRVCILGNGQSPHIRRWARFFRDRGHGVKIISARPAKLEGVEVYTPRLPFDALLRRRKSFDEDRTPSIAVYLSYFVIGLRIQSLLRRMAPDIVMAMTMETNGIISMISGHHPTALYHLGCKALSIKAETSIVMRMLVKRMIRFCDMLYTGDSAGVTRLVELGAERSKIYVNPWGLDLDPTNTQAEALKLRERLGGDKKKIFVSIRVLLPEYDIATFIRAMPRVLAAHPEAVFVIVGDGLERQRLEALARDLGVEGQVTFEGLAAYELLPAYLRAADFYVDPVNFELPSGRTWWGHRMRCSMDGLGYSITLIMALACGCIPLVTRRGGLADVFCSKAQELCLWGPGDPAELAAKAIAAIEAGAALDDLRAEFIRLAGERFDWEKNATQVEREFLEMIAGHATKEPRAIERETRDPIGSKR